MPSFAPARPGRLRTAADEHGFTIVEVLVTALVVVLLAGAAAQALVSQSHTSGDQRLRATASAVAGQDQERLRGLSDQQLANLAASPRPVTVNGIQFSVSSTAGLQDASGNSSCTSTAVDYFKLTSTVSWSENYRNPGGRTQSLTVDSLLSRPVVGVQQTSVTDQTGAGVGGVTVSATPASGTTGLTSRSGTTDASGCSLFVGMSPGSYTIGVIKAGYVDKDGVAAPTKPASVTAGGAPSSTSFRYAPAGGVNATFASTNTSGSTLGFTGEANALTYSGTDGSLSGGGTLTTSTLSQPATAFSASNLFPFYKASAPYTNNYAAYAGKCAYQQPQPATSYNQFGVGPGATTNTTIQEPFLYIGAIRTALGAYVQPADIVLTYSNGSCADSYRATIAPPGSGTTLVPANGWLANPGQPYATAANLSVCVDYKLLGTTFSASVAMANSNMSGPNVLGLPTSLGIGAACTVST